MANMRYSFKYAILLLILAIMMVFTFACSHETTVTTSTSSTSTASTSTSQTAATQTLKIGISAELTGAISVVALPNTKGSQLAVDWVNDNGGITVNGQKYLIELVIEDSKGTTDGAIAAATKLVDYHKVKFIVGTVSPSGSAAASSVTEPAGVIHSIYHGEGALVEMNKDTFYTFRANLVNMEFAPECFNFLLKEYPSVKNIAVLSQETTSTPITFAATEKLAKAKGLNVLGLTTYPGTTTDFYPTLTGVLETKPDAICAAALPQHMAAILKSARELGFTGPIFDLAPAAPDVIASIAGVSNSTDAFTPAPNINDPAMTDIILKVKEMAMAKYGEFTPEYLNGFDPMWTLLQAIEKAQSFDTKVVAQTWSSLNSIETSSGTGIMGGKAYYGVNNVVLHPFAITMLKDGKLEHCGWFMPEDMQP